MVRKEGGWFAVWILLVALSGGEVRAGSTGEVRGTVFIDGRPVDGAVVYLDFQDIGHRTEEPVRREIRQKDTAFRPDFSVLPVGSTLVFLNDDTESHNVHSRSPGNRFDIGIQGPNENREIVLKSPGPVIIRCSIHEGMRGVIYVAPSRHAMVSGPEGAFALSKLPLGSYRLEAWHPRLSRSEVRQSGVEIRIGPALLHQDLHLKAGSPVGADLSEVPQTDWMRIVDDIGAEVERAIDRWEKGKKTSALTLVMTAYSKRFGESGLREAMIQLLGRGRAEVHETRFNTLLKRMQSREPRKPTVEKLRTDRKDLIDGLREDIGRFGSP